jgi:hypothetical protein
MNSHVRPPASHGTMRRSESRVRFESLNFWIPGIDPLVK